MGKSKVVGFDAYIEQIAKIAGDSREICGKTIYQGAAVVADKVKANINALPTRSATTRGSQSSKVKGVTAAEKAALAAGFGIAKMRADGDEYNVALGFDGYMSQKTKGYPNGKPIPMIARSVESGTSWLAKTPFIAPAVKATKAAAEEAMSKACDEEIKKRSV